MRIFLLIACLVIVISPAKAEDIGFCEELKKDSIYKKNSSFKKMIKGKDGWIFRTKTDFNTSFKVNSALKKRFVRLNKAFQDHDIDLVIALLPTRGMMHHNKLSNSDFNHHEAIDSYNALADVLNDIGISVASIEDFSGDTKFYYARDHHWQPEGAKIMAKKVAEKVKTLSSFNSIEKKTYKTESKENVLQDGTFEKFVNETCKTDIKSESVPKYKTYLEDQGEDALFGEESNADILLIGTSNSAQNASKANFDGFLREYIGADVENLSVSGGGVDTSMLDWLSSNHYQGHKPKIVIWEIPIYQNFKGGPFYRQAIPAVYGDCKNPVAEEKSIVTNEKFDISFSSKNISAKGSYAYLRFSDFKGRKFRLTTNYKDGKKEPFDFRRSKFYQPDGTFFFEFDQESDKLIDSIRGLMPKNTKGSITMKICQYPNGDQ